MPPDEERWDARLEELRNFKSQSGHCDVPKNHPGGLGTWAGRQRTARKGGRLDPRRARKLEDEGFRWEVREDRWEARLEELREFRREHGHCDVPHKRPGGLGIWVHKQRLARKGGHLDLHRARKLENEGFRWAFDDEDGWVARFEELREFRREHGHCDVPHRHPGGLGRWVSRQRAALRLGRRLDSRRIRKLEDEGFKWRVGTGKGSRRAAPSKGSDGNEDDDKPNKGVDEGAAGRIREEKNPLSEREGDARLKPAEEPKASRRDFGEQEHAAAAHQRETEARSSEIMSAHTFLQEVDECMRMYKESLGGTH